MDIFDKIVGVLAEFVIFIYICILFLIALVTFPLWVVPYVIWKKNKKSGSR